MRPPGWRNSGASSCSSCCRRLRGGQSRALADNREIAMGILRFGCALIAAAATCASYCAQAEVTRIEIASRTDVLGGKQFGASGAYEKIVGKVFFSVDPAHPRNKAIVDLDKAPRDAAGRVTFSADLYVLAPKDAARGNGVAFFDASTADARTSFAISTAHRRCPTQSPRGISAMAS